jgi:STE24 endopeptidase
MGFAVGKRRSTALRLGGAAVAMVLVAEAAVWLLGPRDEPPDPVPVAESDYFSQTELDRAHDFRSGQLELAAVGIVLELAVLAALALGRPARVRRWFGRFERRPLRGAALAGGAIAALTTLVTLPTRAIAHERAVDVGLSSQSFGSWLWDLARSAAISIALAAIGALLLMALVRRFPRRWWLPGAVAVTGLAVVFTWVAPVVLAPIFNKFEPLPDGSMARADVLELGEEADVDIGEVYRVDASRRVTALNAYVDGLGPTKRVVVYDNLLDQAARPELR